VLNNTGLLQMQQLLLVHVTASVGFFQCSVSVKLIIQITVFKGSYKSFSFSKVFHTLLVSEDF